MPRPRPSRLAMAGVALGATATVVAAFDPATTWWFPSCPFYAITGWLCPLCGSLRSLHALLRGAPLAALAFNPLFVPSLAAWLVARERTAAWWLSARGLTALTAFGLLRNL